MSGAERFVLDGATLRWRLASDDAYSVDGARALAAHVRAGTWEGKPVNSGAVVFASQDGAKKQADALGYLGLASEGPEGSAPSGSFSAREDFGIPAGDA